ncbi:MAG: MetS family NSS transporter small subunit [Actinomycetaceae bacterium]|nr:MetS family NSS transporter small subunit [Actinomycetaceae bacterium]
MSAIAVLMLTITILLVWGGLVASIVMLQILPVPGDADSPSELPEAEPVPDNI